LKESKINKALFTSIIYLIIAGQVWVNIDSFCSWFSAENQTELVELSDIEDNETEEEQQRKLKEDHFSIYTDLNSSEIKTLALEFGHPEDYFLSHYSEIQTPPPRVA
tara:strand:- start:51 stop:371 length:321 start_codon:yes stop_codon:yes gene_type:complete